MKFLAAILSIYIFTLNLVPCEDNSALENEVKTEISIEIDDNHEHQNADLCSPFCICQCCHISITNFYLIDYTIPNPFISTEMFHYTDGLEKDFNLSILQPPQV